MNPAAPVPPQTLSADAAGPLVDVVEIWGADRLRQRIVERRLQGTALLKHDIAGAGATPDPQAGHAAIDVLRSRIDQHRRLLWFDIDGSPSLVGRLLVPLKWLQRRLFRSYLLQQDAFNEYVLAFLDALAHEQQRAPGSVACSPAAHAVSMPEHVALHLRTVPDGPATGTGYTAVAPSSDGLAALSRIFGGSRLVVGSGRGAFEILAALPSGTAGLVLATCQACQDDARRAGLRAVDHSLDEYLAAPSRLEADGAALVGEIERRTPREVVDLLTRLRAALAPRRSVLIVTRSTAAHVSRALESAASEPQLYLYSVEFLSGLAMACGFEVVGVSFP